MDFGYPDGPGSDALLELQLRVARRADELAGEMGGSLLNLHCWLIAEAEVLGYEAVVETAPARQDSRSVLV